MKEIEEALMGFFARHRDQVTTSTTLDDRIRDILSREVPTMGGRSQGIKDVKAPIWQGIIASPRAWGATVAACLAMGLGYLFFTQTSQEAYAISQVLEAVKRVRNVSFKANLYKQQREIVCQMRFQEDSAKPTHVRLQFNDAPQCKIDNEQGSFSYNARTRRFRRIRRDERQADWYPDFREVFGHALAKARWSSGVTIGRATDPDTQKEMIVIDVREKARDVRYWIDPLSKLPSLLTTTATRNEAALRRETIAVKNIWDIRYNDPLSSEAFAVPSAAEEVFEEIDTYVCPGMGMPVGGLTEPEACLKIMRDFIAALNALDFERARNLHFPFGLVPRTGERRMAAIMSERGEPLVTLIDHEAPYAEAPYWYVRCTIKDLHKGVVTEVTRIRFFEFNGERACIIAMPD